MCECKKQCQECCDHGDLRFSKETGNITCRKCAKTWYAPTPAVTIAVDNQFYGQLYPTYNQLGQFLGYYPRSF
jgi:hypothetical protein